MDTALRLDGPDVRHADSPFETETFPLQPGNSLLMALDYSFELPWEARAAGAGLVALVTVAWLMRSA